MKYDCIEVLYENGFREQFFEAVFECSVWTLHGHFSRMVEAIEKQEKYYKSGRMFMVLKNVVSIHLNK